MDGVPLGQREGEAVLAQVVADRDLAAEGVAAALDVERSQVIRVGLHQDRHIQPGELDRVGHALLVAEVGQADQDAVDLVAVLLEQLGAELGVRVGLHRAELGLVLAQRDQWMPISENSFSISRRPR